MACLESSAEGKTITARDFISEENSKGCCIICVKTLTALTAAEREQEWILSSLVVLFCLLRSLKASIQRFNSCRKMEFICF